MSRVILEYNPATNTFTDASGLVFTWAGCTFFEPEGNLSVTKVIQLKEAGFSAEEITEMVKQGVV